MDEATGWIASNMETSQQQIAGQTVSEAKIRVALSLRKKIFRNI
jgi:hypothetical protein